MFGRSRRAAAFRLQGGLASGGRRAETRRRRGEALAGAAPWNRWASARVETSDIAIGGPLTRSKAGVRPLKHRDLRPCISSGGTLKTSQSPYASIAFETTKSEIRNPDGSVVFSLDKLEVPAGWSQVAADVLAQKYFRKAGVPARLKRVEENGVPSFLWRSVADAEALESLPKAERYRLGDLGQAGVRPARRRLDLLGLEGRLFRCGRRRSGLFRRDALHAGATDGRAQFAAMVQHRPALGLRHRWAGAGPLLRRLRERQADQVQVGLRASAAARLLHPVGRRRPRQRGRHHGSVGARGAPVQIRLRHRHEFLRGCAASTRSFRAAAARPA